MDIVLLGLDFIYCYIDDILVASVTEQEHLNHLQMLFKRLNLLIPELEYLGYRISKKKGSKPF